MRASRPEVQSLQTVQGSPEVAARERSREGLRLSHGTALIFAQCQTSPLPQTEKQVYEFDGFPRRSRPPTPSAAAGVVSLTPKAFSILLVLLENRGEVMEKEDLIQRVWPDTFVTEANLTQNVSSLRKALGERANDHRYVVTVPGRGYSFVAPVNEVTLDSTGEYPLLAAGSPHSRHAAASAVTPSPPLAPVSPPQPALAVRSFPSSPPPARLLIAGVILGWCAPAVVGTLPSSS